MCVLFCADIGGILQLGLGEHIGVADLNRALRDLRDTLTGTAALDGDLHAGVLLHELLRGRLAQRLQRGGAHRRDGAGKRLLAGGDVTGFGGAAVGTRATCQTEPGDGQRGHAGDADEAATADVRTLHSTCTPFGCLLMQNELAGEDGTRTIGQRTAASAVHDRSVTGFYVRLTSRAGALYKALVSRRALYPSLSAAMAMGTRRLEALCVDRRRSCMPPKPPNHAEASEHNPL